jgi:hypothetical protein
MAARCSLPRPAAALLPLLALLALLTIGAAAAKPRADWAARYNKLEGRRGRGDGVALFCVVVRTYWGHGQRAGEGGLRRLLRSLQRQTVQA